MRAVSVFVVAMTFALTACSAGAGAGPATNPQSAPTDGDRSGVVEFDGVTVAFRCEGDGSPVVVLEGGEDGTTSFPPQMLDPIAEVTTVCTYDRLGTGAMSSAAPATLRTLGDLANVFDGLMSALGLEPPYVMSGQSWGGNLAIAYAAAHPERVAALVPIEAYHDDPAVIAAEQAEEGSTSEDNPERFDLVAAVEQLDAIQMPIGEFPVLVISATMADEDGPENQAHWLGLSPNSRQIVIDGPHDLQETAPKELAAAIVAVLAELEQP